MMNRLRDQKGAVDPVIARAAELLRSAEPTEESFEQRDRVWRALRSAPRGRGTRFWGFTKPSLVLAVIVGSTAAAAAATAVGRRWIERTYLSVTMHAAAPSEIESPRSVRRRLAGARPEAPNVPEPPVVLPEIPADSAAHDNPAETPVAAPVAAKQAPSIAVKPAAPLAVRSVPASKPPERGVGIAAVASAPKDEASLVLSAMTALRRDRDPARSAKLLDDYLARYPRGVLREEALALEIECASSRGDAQASDRLARSYLRSYPHGRFQEVAHDALSHAEAAP
jgi:hypothetical protein